MRLIHAICAAFLLLAAPAAAELARELGWRDLAPGGEAIVDPLAELTGDQKLDIEAIAWARAAERRGEIGAEDEESKAVRDMAKGLARQGLDVDALVAKYAAFRAEVEAHNRHVDEGLHDRLVRIPGYALPLEFTGAAVTEFLLVPYFGACIHVPPPPPNQMVFVTLKRPYAMTRLFEPVWITGRMKVESGSRSLSFVDGTAALETGYSIDGSRIEPYE